MVLWLLKTYMKRIKQKNDSVNNIHVYRFEIQVTIYFYLIK